MKKDSVWRKLKAALPLVALLLCGTPSAFATTKVGDVLIPGKKVEFTVDLEEDSLESLSYMGITKLRSADVGLWVPANFDPSRRWNILLVSATDNASSVARINQYLDAAETVGGWIVMAADGTIRPDGKNNDVFECDTYRFAVMRAGLRALAAQWPAARTWPVAVGGFSGGAKRSGFMSVILMLDGYSLIGMWLGGCNEDTPSMAKLFNDPGDRFLDVPVFLSVGDGDSIASVSDVREVQRSMQTWGGFRATRLKIYRGGHTLYSPHVKEALRWFAGGKTVDGTVATLDRQGGNGGTAEVEVTYGKAMPAITPPTRDGYAFQGYYEAANGGGMQYYTKTGASTRAWDVSADATLYAKWTAMASYTVKFSPNGGTGKMALQRVARDANTALQANVFTRAGCTFTGWATSASGAVVHADRASVKNLAAAGGTVTLYAQWAKTTYKVAFQANGGTGRMKTQKMTYGKASKLRKNAFKRKGYAFAGWAVKKGGAIKYKNRAKVENLRTDGKTTTLYAVWARKHYKVVFKANGGTGRMKAQKMTYGKSSKLRKNSFNRKGHTFAGWAVKKSGAVKYKDAAKVKNLRKDGNIRTLYAVWTKKSAKSVPTGLKEAGTTLPESVADATGSTVENVVAVIAVENAAMGIREVAERVLVTARGGENADAVADGDETTAWTTDAANGAWVVLTFPEPRNVGDVEVVGENLPEGTRFLISEDADDWREKLPGTAQYLWVVFPAGDGPLTVKEIRVLPE